MSFELVARSAEATSSRRSGARVCGCAAQTFSTCSPRSGQSALPTGTRLPLAQQGQSRAHDKAEQKSGASSMSGRCCHARARCVEQGGGSYILFYTHTPMYLYTYMVRFLVVAHKFS